MLTEEEKERRRKMMPGGTSGVSFLDQLGPLAPVAQKALSVLDYPRHAVTEDIQRVGEMREVYGERGLGGLASHLTREIGSDVLDFTSDISKGLIPEGWGERLDPSDETQMGLLFEQSKEVFRSTEGRDPSLDEQYMMKTSIQDAAMPKLTERHELLGLDFSTRAALELAGEIPAVATEIALTGGSATVGRKALTSATRAAAKIAQSQVGKGAKREAAGRAAGKAVIGGGHSVNQTFQVPRYADIAVGATVGRALGIVVAPPMKLTGKAAVLGLKGTMLPAKATLGGLRMSVNYFRRDALNRGALGSEVNRKATEAVEKASRQGKLDEGTQLHFRQRGADLWSNDALDSPGADGTPWWRRIYRGTHPKGSDPTPPTGDALYDSFRPVDGNPDAKRLLTKDISTMQFIRDSVREIGKDLGAVLSKRREAIFGRRIQVAPELVEEEKAWVGLARRIGKIITSAQDQWVNRQEAMVAKARSQTYYYLGALEKAGMLRWNVGGYTGRIAAALDDEGTISLASGNSFTGLLDGSAKDAQRRGNHSVVMPDIPSVTVGPKNQGILFEEGIGESGYTLRGHTRVMVSPVTGKPTHYLDEAGNAAGPMHSVERQRADGSIMTITDPATDVVSKQMDWVADNLDPTIGDIIENIGLYKNPLRSVRNVIQRIDGQGNPIEGDWMNAYEVFEEMANIARELENALGAAGSGLTRAFTARSVSSGGNYFPRNVLGSDGVAEGKLPHAKPVPELAFGMEQTGRFLPSTHSKERLFASQAEGQWSGQWYIDPSMAMDDYATYVAKHIMAIKTGQFVSRVADAYGIPNGTADDLLKDHAEYQEMLKYGQKLEDAVTNVLKRQKEINPKGTAAKIKKAQNLFEQMHKWQQLHTIFGAQDKGMNITILEHLGKLQEQADLWWKEVDAAKGTWAATVREKQQLTRALNQHKKAVADAKKAVTKDFKSIAGVGDDVMEGLYFPKIFGDTILKTNVARDKANDYFFLATMNAWLRMVGATGDFSAFGIQGWTGVLNDSIERGGVFLDQRTGGNTVKIDRRGDAFTALQASWEAFRTQGDQIVGEYFWRQEQMSRQMGTLTPTDAANAGLAILKNAPDLNFSASKSLRNIPGIKNFDRAFTHYGNVFRYELFDTQMALEMLRRGKTAQQLVSDGTATEIATVANFASGVGKRGFLAGAGQMLLFAPRFLHARMKMLNLAAEGLLPGFEKTAQRRVAAQHLSRAFGQATYLTFMINEMLGEETDINPVARNKATGEWYFNPNFLRIHAGPIDVSLLGPYDSMLRLMSIVPVMAANRGKGLKNLGDLRNAISAPGTSVAIDAIRGQDAIGQKKFRDFPDEIYQWPGWLADDMLEHLTPFAWSELLHSQPGQESISRRAFGGAKQLASEPLKGISTIAAGVGQTVGQVLGVKSSYETISESMNEAYNDILENMTYDQKLQVFGVDTKTMTEEEMEQLWAQAGEAWWKRAVDIGEDASVSISFRGMLGDSIPQWEDLANDHKKKIKEMISTGAFKDVMTPKEMADFESRINERRGRSANAYDQYKLEREGIDRRQIDAMRTIESAYNNPDPAWGKGWIRVTYTDEEGKETTEKENIASGDLKAYSKFMRDVSSRFARARRTLTAPGGTFYKVVEDLFGDDELPRNVSDWDVDIYDAAQYFYFDTFYEDTKDKEGNTLPSIVSGLTGMVDWDLKDKKTELWYEMMEQRYPSIDRGRLKRYLWRVEDSMVKDAPPLAGTLFEIQQTISRTAMVDGATFYQLDKIGIDLLTKYSGLPREKVEDFYIRWNGASSDQKPHIATEARKAGIRNIEDIASLRQKSMDRYFNMADDAARGLSGQEYQLERDGRAYLEGLIVLLDKRYGVGKKQPYSRHAREVLAILERHRMGTIPIPSMTEFVMVVAEGTSLDKWTKLKPGSTVVPKTKVTQGTILTP